VRIAVVMTVKDEDDVIFSNILYHKHIGVTDFYIYLDGSTDNTLNIVRELSNVNIKYSSLPKWMLYEYSFDRYTSRYQTHHTARQIINCFDAVELARKNGIKWVISIDPDELICLDKERVIRDSLKEFLFSLPSNIYAVTFPTLEVIPRKLNYTNVFAEETFFKAPYSYGEGRRIGESASGLDEIPEPEILYSSNEIQNKWQDLHSSKACQKYHTSLDLKYLNGVLDVPHLVVHNPKLDSQLIFDWYVGHFIGKQAFRIDRDVSFQSLHSVALPNRDNELVTGYLLHYNNYSAVKFLKKYKAFSSHPETYTLGYSVDTLKIFLRNLVNFSGMNENSCIEIFSDSFIVDSCRLSVIRERWAGAIEVVEAVKHFFDSLT